MARPIPDAAPVTRRRFPAKRPAAPSIIALDVGSCRSHDLCGAGGTCVEQLARQFVADDRLGEAGAFDQPIEIDAGVDTELAAKEYHLFAADIAGCRLVAGEGTAAE